ncbi:MAG: type-F conjugative transfer system pilin assembly protein TrbC [Gammaproteobacteria bacterium]|nr:type-F conjugative transfer system pilin assembly protein TrbC [Gammaproteobacteria bacterium]
MKMLERLVEFESKIFIKFALLVVMLSISSISVASRERGNLSNDFVEDFGHKVAKAVKTNQFGIPDSELRHIKQLGVAAQNISFSNIFAKWQELQQILGSKKDLVHSGLDVASIRDIQRFGEIKVFVSNSMGERLLQTYVAEAKKYGATLIFAGLPNDASGKGSWKELGRLVGAISSGDEIAMQINDKEFKEYGISSVPTIVMLKNLDEIEALKGNEVEVFDKVTGNVGIRGALELFASEGELKSLADGFLRLVSGNR